MLKMPHKDRGAHFVYGACVANVAMAATGLVMMATDTMSRSIAAGIGLGSAAFVGAAKELADRYLNSKEAKAGLAPTHGVSSADFAWTVFGGLCAAMPTFFLGG